MRYMMMVKGNEDSEAGANPGPEVFEAMGKYNEQLISAGVLLAADGLQPSSKGIRISDANGERTVVDGPFAEAKELIAGYWMIQVKSREEAVEWASRVPFFEGQEIEVRQVFEADDFADLAPAEVVQREQEWRDSTQRPITS